LSIKVAHITTIAASLPALMLHRLRSLEAAGFEVTSIGAAGPEVAVLDGTGIRHIAVPMSRRISPFADLLSLWRGSPSQQEAVCL